MLINRGWKPIFSPTQEELMQHVRTSLLALAGLLIVVVMAACQSTQLPVDGGLESTFTIDPTIYAKGWVWADNPTATLDVPYTPHTFYQYNNRFDNTSKGVVTYPAADNTVVRWGLGSYEVIFPNLGVRGGVVHVSAYGGKHTCKVVRWNADLTPDLHVFVRCFNPSNGANLNGRFTVLFYKDGAKSRDYADAYVWADQESVSSYIPALEYNYNSRGVNNRVQRIAPGQYGVTLPQMEGRGGLLGGGIIMVTAYGDSNVYCKNIGFSADASLNIIAQVRCYKGGILDDSKFTLSFFRDPSALAIRNTANKKQAWYVLANVTPIPHTGHQTDSYGNHDATLTRLALGSYRVHLPRIAAFDKTFAHITAYDTNTSYCNLVSWVTSPSGGTNVNVKCYSPSGAAADSIFSLYYASDDPL
jgi:hypothetical protein